MWVRVPPSALFVKLPGLETMQNGLRAFRHESFFVARIFCGQIADTIDIEFDRHFNRLSEMDRLPSLPLNRGTSLTDMKHVVHNGWKVRFRRNIHMYCHSLTVSKHNLELQVPCEDTPDGYVGIWPYDLDIPEARYRDLLVALRSWAQTIQSDYRLYSTRDEYEAGPDRNTVDESLR